MKTSQIIGTLVVIVVIGGGSFYGGMKYDQRVAVAARANRGGGFAMMNAGGAGAVRGGARFGGGAVVGEVFAKDDTSITVKLRNGGSQIVFFSESTQVMKTTDGSSKDLVVGEQVTVMGSPNADGSVNAQTIQIRPAQPTNPQL